MLLFTSTDLLNLLLSGLNENQSINCEIAFLINMFYDCLHTQKPNCINCKYLIVWLTDGKAIMQSINMSTSAPVSSLKVICILTSSSVMVASTANIVVTTLSRTLYLMCSMTTSSSTSSFPSLLSSMSCKSKKPRKVRQKKKKKWGWQLSSWQMFFFGGGKCPNLVVGNVRILGVVNVRLANNLTPSISGGIF